MSVEENMALARRFLEEHGDIFVKPLHGNGGKAIFKIGRDGANLSSLIEVFNTAYREPHMVQAFLPSVAAGDKPWKPVSDLGFMAECDLAPKRGAVISFAAPNGESFSAVIRWARDGRIGCRFATPLEWEDLVGLGLDELDSDEVPAAPRKPKR